MAILNKDATHSCRMKLQFNQTARKASSSRMKASDSKACLKQAQLQWIKPGSDYGGGLTSKSASIGGQQMQPDGSLLPLAPHSDSVSRDSDGSYTLTMPAASGGLLIVHR